MEYRRVFLHIERASFLPGLCSHYSALVEPGAFVAIGDPATANVDHVAACGDLFLLVVVSRFLATRDSLALQSKQGPGQSTSGRIGHVDWRDLEKLLVLMTADGRRKRQCRRPGFV
jgi:hypothetical protein